MITITVQSGPSFQLAWNNGMNVEDALKEALNSVPQGTFSYALQYFGKQLGYLVCMINETYESFPSKPTQKPFFFWEFLLNGVVSQIGIDSAVLSDGDKVLFVFTTYDGTVSKDSTLHAKYKLKTGHA